MGAAREGRPSEKRFAIIWGLLPHLLVCLWHPLQSEALEYIRMIRKELNILEDLVMEEMKNEKEGKELGF